ncbi:hypothetical protein WICMUC_003948 [Wickerhamomyces mucosus]|uniref:Anaphase-promoting complex subunit 4 WD40 domain-containing protein n=1 Tax=Wickerhamomyces mucosus TaxID=1378264 RepID=A0A9P8TC20_9ASCO|nr:hypothetical protein WICMUC_003948 [Wickerhamomyces mucosus]
MVIISIQPSFEEVIHDVEIGNVEKDQFWINILASDNVEDGIALEEIVEVSKEDELKFHNKNGLIFERKISKDVNYELTYDSLKYKIKTPKRKLTINDTINILTSFDVSQDQSHFLVCTGQGDIIIHDMDTFSIKAHIHQAHLSTISKSLFFPSGKVILSSGLDYQIKVWSIDEVTSPARVFKGHTQDITDLAMVENGRNFFSASKDGFIKLWDCGSGSNIRTLQRSNSIRDGVTALKVTNQQSNTKFESSFDSNEFGTSGKNLFAGQNSGIVTLFDLNTKEEVLHFNSLNDKVNVLVDQSTPDELIVGYGNGIIAEWDIRNPINPITEINLNGEINSISRSGSDLVISYGSGYIFQIDGKFKELRNQTIYAGIDDNFKFTTQRKEEIYAANNQSEIVVF